MSDAPHKFRAAAVQAAPVLNDRQACLAKAVSLIREAANQGANLIVFPETWLPGYPFWIWPFQGKSVGDRSAIRRTFAQLHSNAVEIPSPTTDALCEVAREVGSYVVVGLHERDAQYSRGTLYNTLLYHQ